MAPVLINLYRPAPDGFNAAISEAERLFSADPTLRGDAKLWAYLAFGLGQKYEFERDKREPDPEVLRITADRAYEALRTCLQIDPDQRHWPQTMWHPNDPGFSSIDDDLTVFFCDASQSTRFKELLRYEGPLPLESVQP